MGALDDEDMLQDLYESALILPGLAWLGTAVGMLALWRLRLPTDLRVLLALCGLEIALDAWLNTALSPLDGRGGWATASGVIGVILGDMRYFVLRARLRGRLDRRAWLAAALAALLVPVSVQLLVRVPFPTAPRRVTFLIYELVFAAWVSLHFWRSERADDAHDGARKLHRFVLVQYVLWASADVLLLLGVELGWLLRIVPNLLYYVAFVPFAVAVLARRSRAPSPTTRRAALGVTTMLSVLAVLLAQGCGKARPLPDVSLRFVLDDTELRHLGLAELAAEAPPVEIDTDDAYYGRRKRFRALPLHAVLALGFAGHDTEDRELIVRARDGYAVPLSAAQLAGRDAYLAFADLDVQPYAPIGPNQTSPFPLYLVWTDDAHRELEQYPRPWQIESLEWVRFAQAFPHTSPGELPESAPAARGYTLFRTQCFKCHAINREGGRLGPDLNVPKNVLEYRDESFVRAYVVDPRAFRYGAMPAHPDLRPADLDALIAYLGAMRSRKFDPGH